MTEIPKRIWMLWTQGIDQMPATPRACVESWREQNPRWELTLLTAKTLCAHTDPRLSSPAAQSLLPYRLSELARLSLLLRHGGVWADATCYCMRPLDDWVFDCIRSGFFAFDRPGRDRLLSNWFLAATPNHYIVRRMWEALESYYFGHKLSDEGWRRTVRKVLQRLLNRTTRTTSLWFHWPLPQLGVSPYLSFHYIFTRLVQRDPHFQQAWARVPKISADGPHRLQRHQADGLAAPPPPEVIEELRSRRVPVYKLNWRVDPAKLAATSTLNTLLDGRYLEGSSS